MEAVDTIITSTFGDLSTSMTGVIIPAMLGLVAIGVAIALGVKYIKKGASKA